MASDSGLPARPVPYPAFDGTQPCRDLDPELFFPRNSKESWYHPLKTPVWVSDARMVRDLLVELDDGETNSKVIAGQVGCSAATVQRWRRQREGAA